MSTGRTVEQLAAEEAEVARLEATQPVDELALRIARNAAQLTKRLLQANGYLPFEDAAPTPPQDPIERQLDKLFPSARNREEVSFDGRQYRRRFAPKEKTADGRVLGWIRTWEPVET